MIDEDHQLEVEIDRAYARLVCAETPSLQSEAFAHMRSLIYMRSAEQVARMERDKGLIHPPVRQE